MNIHVLISILFFRQDRQTLNVSIIVKAIFYIINSTKLHNIFSIDINIEPLNGRTFEMYKRSNLQLIDT